MRLTFAIALLVAACSAQPPRTTDLSGLADAPLRLDGEWSFTPGRFVDTIRDDARPLAVPGSWTREHDLPEFGTGTASLRLQHFPGGELAVSSRVVRSASRVVVRELATGRVVELARSGVVGETRTSTVPSHRPLEGSAALAAGDLVLSIQLANFHDAVNAGLTTSVFIGRPHAIAKHDADQRAADFLLVGMILAIGLYMLVIYWLRRSEKAPLWLAVFCFLIAARPLLIKGYVPGPYDLVFAANYSTFLFGVVAFIMFMRACFPAFFRRTVVMGTGAVFTALTLFVFVAPSWIFTHAYRGAMTLTLGVAVYFVVALVRGAWCDRSQAAPWISLGGTLAVVIALAVEGVSRMVGGNHAHLMPVGMLAFLFAQAVIVSMQNAEARRTAEYLSEHLSHEVTARTKELAAANAKLETARNELWAEMELTRRLQCALVPQSPRVSGYDVAAYLEPADEVGGDYYDVINVRGRTWVAIGDVSGHGVTAGLVMMMVQTAIHTVLDKDPDIAPKDLLRAVNGIIAQNVAQLGEDRYMTLMVMAVDDGRMCFAGLHQDLFVFRAATGKVERVMTQGTWIGLAPNIDDLVEDSRIDLCDGDALLLYTDGITEACKNGGSRRDMYGDDRLVNVFERVGDAPAQEIRAALLASMTGYAPSDDVTILVLKKEPVVVEIGIDDRPRAVATI